MADVKEVVRRANKRLNRKALIAYIGFVFIAIASSADSIFPTFNRHAVEFFVSLITPLRGVPQPVGQSFVIFYGSALLVLPVVTSWFLFRDESRARFVHAIHMQKRNLVDQALFIYALCVPVMIAIIAFAVIYIPSGTWYPTGRGYMHQLLILMVNHDWALVLIGPIWFIGLCLISWISVTPLIGPFVNFGGKNG